MTRQLPQDIETEKSLLATLCAPGADQIAAELSSEIRMEDFMHPGHRAVWAAVQGLIKSGTELNTLTIRDAMSAAGSLGTISGFTGLTDLLMGEEVGKPRVLVGILRRHRQRREMLRCAAELANAAQDMGEDVSTILEASAAQIAAIGQEREGSTLEPVWKISDEAMARLADRMAGKSWGTTFQGFSRISGVTHGFQPGQLIILAARPGVGKTALALNLALGALQRDKGVAFFSLEMSNEEVFNRLAGAHSKVDLKAMVETRDESAFRRVMEAKIDIDQMDLMLSDRSEITAQQITSQVDAMLARGRKVGLVIVDYLQLISSPHSTKNEAVRVGEISRALKILAKDRHVPVLVLSQLNRDVEKRGKAARPQLSDLRDSGALEQDADIVMFLHRNEAQPGKPDTELIFAKHRNGPLATIPMKFDGPTTRYLEVERETAYDGTGGTSNPAPMWDEEWCA